MTGGSSLAASSTNRLTGSRSREIVDDQVCGFLTCMSPTTAPAFADEDPIVGPRLAHARADGRLGDSVLWHDSFDFTGWPAGQTSDSPIGGPRRPGEGDAGDGGDPALRRRQSSLHVPPGQSAQSGGAGSSRRPPAPTTSPSSTASSASTGWNATGSTMAPAACSPRCASFVYAELGLTEPADDDGDEPPIDRQLVRDALRSFHVPHELAQSPLAHGDSTEERAEAARALLRHAAGAGVRRHPERTAAPAGDHPRLSDSGAQPRAGRARAVTEPGGLLPPAAGRGRSGRRPLGRDLATPPPGVGHEAETRQRPRPE